ncbi:MAG: CGNR zinc finger domain-containing protein [Candidatus Bipolaricaulia bacterium]
MALSQALARSATEIPILEDLQRVGECADPRCGWLFLDRSRNRTRRWCDMKGCGNRAKVRRYYEQRRATGKPTTPGGSPGSDGGAPLLFGP